MAQYAQLLPPHKIGYVGIGIDTVVTEEGVFIQSLYDGGPADQAGLLVGDRLIGVAERAVSSHPLVPVARGRGGGGDHPATP